MENWTDKIVTTFVAGLVAVLLFGMFETVRDGLNASEEPANCNVEDAQ